MTSGISDLIFPLQNYLPNYWDEIPASFLLVLNTRNLSGALEIGGTSAGTTARKHPNRSKPTIAKTGIPAGTTRSNQASVDCECSPCAKIS